MLVILLIALLLLFLVLRVPIFISLTLASMIVLFLGTDSNMILSIQSLFGGLDTFVLMALPLFLYAAEIMVSGGLSKRLVNWAKSLVGHITGGMAMTTQASSMLFGSLSGSSPATVAAVGKVMYPEMIKNGYRKNFTSGLLTSSGSIAIILPPSITLIVYASAANVSVGELFMAGIGAGLFYGLIYLAYIYYYGKKNNFPKSERVPLNKLWQETKSAIWAILVPLIILGGIYFGIFTPTESAAVAIVYSIIISMFVYKELDLKGLYQATMDAVISSAQILILIASASFLGYLLTVLQVPQMISDALLGNELSAWMFLLILNVILLVIGMFIDASTAVVIITPLILTTATQMEVDLVHLGIIMVANLAIGMFTPPFGLNIYIAMDITGLGLGEMMKGLWRFLIISIIILILLTYIPQISMFIPEQIYFII